jgi:FdhE protein
MESFQVAPAVASPWASRRRRASHLAERWPHAAEMLRLYAALLDVQEPASQDARGERPGPEALPGYVAARVVPAIVAATVATGPRTLADALRAPLGDPEAAVRRWLAGENQAPTEEYVARAATAPVLEALGPAGLPRPAVDGGCPHCGGRPQLAYVTESSESLLTPPRRLLCSRCGRTWVHPRLVCAACGEHASARLPIFADEERLPALRADACESCHRYLIAVDGRKDPAALPEVDELVALPLDLHARERGFVKIVPNLMGI